MRRPAMKVLDAKKRYEMLDNCIRTSVTENANPEYESYLRCL